MKKKNKSKEKDKLLENSISDKFTEALQALGHDVEKLKKEVAKAGKSIAKKIGSIGKEDKKAKKQDHHQPIKPEKKQGKSSDADKTSVKKAQSKTEKLAAAINKANAGKVSAVSSRSVKKPVLPVVSQQLPAPEENDAVKEASAETPAKRTRAPRKKKETPEPAKENKENIGIKEASEPVKRKRAPRKTKTGPVQNKITSSEITGSNVLR